MELVKKEIFLSIGPSSIKVSNVTMCFTSAHLNECSDQCGTALETAAEKTT